jgi:hypothetical protein
MSGICPKKTIFAYSNFAMIKTDFSTLEPKKNILIKGAQLHNLKNIDVAIPRNKLVVITGLSGSGKSSLAFDTLYAEGQRRYVESLSSYARQFLGRLDKPKVEYIKGIAPAIAICHCHRAEGEHRERPLYSWHQHRDLRLHEAAFCAHWPYLFARFRPRGEERYRDGCYQRGEVV